MSHFTPHTPHQPAAAAAAAAGAVQVPQLFASSSSFFASVRSVSLGVGWWRTQHLFFSFFSFLLFFLFLFFFLFFFLLPSVSL